MRIIIKEDFCEDLILEVHQETDFYYLCHDEEGYVYRVRKNECSIIKERPDPYLYGFAIGGLVAVLIFSLYMLFK